MDPVVEIFNDSNIANHVTSGFERSYILLYFKQLRE